MTDRTPRRFDLVAWLTRGQRPLALGATAVAAIVVGSVLGLVLGQRDEAAAPTPSPSPVAVATATASPDATPAPLGTTPPTPTATPTPTPTPTPSATASPTPTPTPAATPRATATPTPTPTPRATARPTATPSPVPSPGPDAIAFHGGDDIWTVNPDGTQLVNRTRTPNVEEANPVWSGDGAYLAFQSWAEGGGVDIMNADGSGRRRVADGFARNAGYFTDGLAWAPDGNRLAIALVRGDIVIVDVETGEETDVGDGSRWLAWSASGRYLAWGARGTIWVYDSDSGESFDVVTMDSNVRFLNWFPDEERLLFIGFTDAGNADLFAVNLDGSELGPILETDPNEDGAYLSADGTRVLFFRGFPTSTSQEVALLEIGGSEATPVLEGAGPVIARWASDDSRAVAEQNGTIYLLPLDGSDPVEITEGSAPVWRPSP